MAGGDRLDRFFVVSGCSGGGKSTLLDALSRRGFAVVPEPGRRIVQDELRGDGSCLPWRDLEGFARRAVALSLEDRRAAAASVGPVFFDRGLVDAAVALDHATGGTDGAELAGLHRYAPRVFLVPPWPEIHRRDEERRHGFSEAVAEYDRLRAAYLRFGYDAVVLPKAAVEERADIVLAALDGFHPRV